MNITYMYVISAIRTCNETSYASDFGAYRSLPALHQPLISPSMYGASDIICRGWLIFLLRAALLPPCPVCRSDAWHTVRNTTCDHLVTFLMAKR